MMTTRVYRIGKKKSVKNRLHYRRKYIEARMPKLIQRDVYHQRLSVDDLPTQEDLFTIYCEPGHILQWSYHDRPQML
jgi:hypothetical protein